MRLIHCIKRDSLSDFKSVINANITNIKETFNDGSDKRKKLKAKEKPNYEDNNLYYDWSIFGKTNDYSIAPSGTKRALDLLGEIKFSY